MIPGKQYTPADLLAIASRRKWLLVLPLLVVGIGTAIVTRALPNRYRSETLILVVPQRVPESYVKSTVTSNIADRLQSISQQILSRTRLERIIQDLNLYEKARRTDIMQDVVEGMRKDIEVDLVKGDAFRVTYTGDEPRTVMQVTERLASLFIEENLRDRAVLAEDSYQFLDSQLDDARRRLVEHEKKLEEYRRKYTGQLPTQLESNLQIIQNTQLQIQALDESMARDRDRRLIVERSIADADFIPAPATPALPSSTPGEVSGGTAAQQLEAAQQALAQLELRLKPEHPDVVRVKRLIAGLKDKAAIEAAGGPLVPSAVSETLSQGAATRRNRLKELQAELSSIDRQIARKEGEERQLRDQVKIYQGRVEATPTRESELIELTRDYDTLQKTYTSLLMKKEDSKIASNLEQRQIGEQFKILDRARVPERPYSPDRLRLNLIGALAGLVLGFALTALLEYGDSTLKTDDDVVNALGLPVLALVPMMVTSREQRQTRHRRFLALASSAAVGVLTAVALIVWKLRS